MKTGMVLLATIIVTCAVTLVSGRRPNPVPANHAQDYRCAMLSVNVSPRARPVGVVQIPSPAANFIAIGHWAATAGTVSGVSLSIIKIAFG